MHEFRKTGFTNAPRHELKYIVPAELEPDLRALAEPFCIRDPFGTGAHPKYRVTTLQLDNEFRSLHLAKERERLNRFKLRVRTYGEVGTFPEVLEIKRKLEDRVLKSRFRLPEGTFSKQILGESCDCTIRDSEKADPYWDFVRLVNQVGAKPVALIRYDRESWVGKDRSNYRLTMDRNLEYCMSDKWSLESSGAWRRMDTAIAFQVPFAPLILEMKSPDRIPEWMLRIVRFFSLQRVGVCKYSTAMRLESLFEGCTYSDASENTSYL